MRVTDISIEFLANDTSKDIPREYEDQTKNALLALYGDSLCQLHKGDEITVSFDAGCADLIFSSVTIHAIEYGEHTGAVFVQVYFELEQWDPDEMQAKKASERQIP